MRFSLRLKITLVSLLLFFIPLTGFRFSEMIKRDLVASRKEAMLFSARAVASSLAGRPGLFDRELFRSLNPSRDLYVYQLSNPMRINGKTDDWEPHLSEAREFAENNVLYSQGKYDYNSLHYKHLTGVRGEYLYALFEVTDDTIVYRNANSLRLDLSDHLQIGIEDQQGKLHQYLLTAKKPGWVNGFLMPGTSFTAIPIRSESKIQGMWEETETGYLLEIRIPTEMVGQKLAFAIGDVDDPDHRTLTTIIGTAGNTNSRELGWLLSPSDAIEDILKSLDRPHSRVLIVDTNQRVRASFGKLAEPDTAAPRDASLLGKVSSATYRLFSPVYQFFMRSFTTEFSEPPPQPTTLNIRGVREALKGVSSVTSYTLETEGVEIMAAITPLLQDNTIIGAVVVEQTTNSILALQNKVIEESLTLTILAFIFGGLGLLLFSFRLSSRIRKLGRQAAAAISDHGQIRSTIEPSAERDEIGDLTRSLTSMLEQLRIQTEYREKMADNLEHEMRTPLAGISASLKNLAREITDPVPHITEYLNWALQDVARLEGLLTSIRDATSLHEALGHDFKEDFELDRAIGMWLAHSWQLAFPDVAFIYDQPQEPVVIHGDPARIRQLLDKLIENGVSFHKPGTPISIKLLQRGSSIELSIANEGPVIAEELQKQIFNSMVSFRQQKDSRPHLGLGLYIVRTIVEHHKGTIAVATMENGAGTVFTIRMAAGK